MTAAWPGGSCGAQDPPGDNLASFCGATPTVVRLIVGCVNEHQEDVRLCGPHAASILGGHRWLCGPCHDQHDLDTTTVVLAKVLPSGERQRVLES
ncbi:hypothetical protein [Nonomuraea sp. NPDC049784]|uniref:hypothetical protein n=1 Tax=Nonomuraea sp. NPDC049784 TaxID=3154361 RepID=UPI0033F89259